MKVLCAVPSKGRAVLFSKKTQWWLSKTNADWRVFVEPQDAEMYSSFVPQERLVVMERNNPGGLWYAKQQIRNYAEQRGYDLVFKFDDDCDSLTTRGGKSTETSVRLYHQAIKDAVDAFEKYPLLGAVCYPYRNEMYQLKKWTGLNARLQSCYLLRTQLLQGDPPFSTFEDFANFVYIRVNGFYTLRYGLMGLSLLPVGKTDAGANSYDRGKQAWADIEAMRKIYPALRVKRVEGKPWPIEPDFRGDTMLGGKGL